MPLGTFLESLLQDLRQVIRGLHRSPATLWMAVLTMALGAGAVAAVFSAVDPILFRDLPYPQSDRLITFGVKAPINPSEFLLEGSYYAFREQQKVLTDIGSVSGVGDCDVTERDPVRLHCRGVSASFLKTLGVHPEIGRDILPAEDVRNGPLAALISYGLWERRYGKRPDVLGHGIVINGRPTQIVGVLPRNFEMPDLAPIDILIPQQLNIAPNVAGNFLHVYGRMKPDITLQQATAALYPIYVDTLREVPAPFRKEISFHVTSVREMQTRDHRTAAAVLFGCVIALLAIACANVANLLLARAAGRERELAVRSAIGATPWRLIQHALMESLLLSIIGAAVGLAFAAGLLRALRALAPEGIPRLAQASLDWRVFSFTLASCIAAGIIFGLVNAIRMPRLEALNESRTVGRGLRIRQALVALQVGLSVTLLAGAGLLLRSLWNLEQVPLGINPAHVLTAEVQSGRQYQTEPQRVAFFERVLDKMKELPGVEAVAVADSVPLVGQPFTMITNRMAIEGRPPVEDRAGTGGMVILRTVTPEYFRALGIRLLRGRGFSNGDTAGEIPVIVSETFARKIFPNEDPIGKRMKPFVDWPEWRRIVGVAADVKNTNLVGRDDPEYYTIWRTNTVGNRHRASLILRTEANPAEMANAVRMKMADIDPTLPVTISTLETGLDRFVERPRFQSVLLSLFAIIGMLLAAVGQFGVISTMVNDRAPEIGVRIALGATSRNVVSLVLRHTMSWTLMGVVAGIAGAWWATRAMQSLLFGVKATDVPTFAAALAVLLLVSALAAWNPARHATKVDPARVLRHT